MTKPKILLIGDSIRLGYDALTREAYKDVAHVFFPSDNCRFSTYVLRNLHEWKEELKCTEVDCVHWNVGAWDTLTLYQDGPLVPLDAYKDNLRRICKRMEILFPGAKKIFATTTPMREELFQSPEIFIRYNRDIEIYNEAAIGIVKEYGHEINDLYELMKDMSPDYHSDVAHYYTRKGAMVLTKRVCSVLDDALGIKSKEADYDSWFDKTDCYEGGAWLEKRAEIIRQRAMTLGV